MRARVLLGCLLVAAAILSVAAVEFHSCLDEHVVKIEAVEVDPVVIPVRGEGAAVVNGYTTVPLSKGFANVTVFKEGKEYVVRQYDLCRELMHHETCPLNGRFEIRVPIFWPRDDATEGQYSVQVELFEVAHRLTQVACFTFDVSVAPHSAENCGPCGTH